MEHVVQLQPVTVVYRPAHGMDARFFGWWGEMDFAPHLLSVLAARRGGEVAVILHQPRPADTFGDRKALAAWCEATVRGAHPDGQAAYG
jgi:lyso-ornithine lipid O-acyltransferase